MSVRHFLKQIIPCRKHVMGCEFTKKTVEILYNATPYSPTWKEATQTLTIENPIHKKYVRRFLGLEKKGYFVK